MRLGPMIQRSLPLFNFRSEFRHHGGSIVWYGENAILVSVSSVSMSENIIYGRDLFLSMNTVVG